MDEKPFDLRDKIALEILNGILCNEKGKEATSDIVSHLDCENQSWREVAQIRLEHLIRNCYKVADIVRKVRLATFE